MIIFLVFLIIFCDNAMSEKRGCGCSGIAQGSTKDSSQDTSKDKKKKEIPSVSTNCCG